MDVQEEPVFFENGRGQRLTGLLHASRPDHPVIILCHGFTSRKENGKNEALVSLLASCGFGSLRFDFFGHGNSEGRLRDITLSEGVRDVEAAYRFLRARFPRSPIALFGSSFGGSACFYAAPSLDIAGMVLACPAIHYFENKQRLLGAQGITEWRKKGYMVYKDWKGKGHKVGVAFLDDIEHFQPDETAARIRVKTLIIHGAKDKVIAHAGSARIVKRLTDGTLTTYKDADHNFSGKGQSDRLVHDAAGFFCDLFAMLPEQTHGRVL